MAALLSTDRVALLLDADGDLDISAGRLQFTSGQTAFAQGADARIKLIRGELFFNRKIGVRWVENDEVEPGEALIGQAYDEAKARREITAAIAGTPGFGALVSMSLAFNPATRRLAIAWHARTAFGDVTSSVEV